MLSIARTSLMRVTSGRRWLENINLVADPANSFKIIMKDGVIYKNTLGD